MAQVIAGDNVPSIGGLWRRDSVEALGLANCSAAISLKTHKLKNWSPRRCSSDPQIGARLARPVNAFIVLCKKKRDQSNQEIFPGALLNSALFFGGRDRIEPVQRQVPSRLTYGRADTSRRPAVCPGSAFETNAVEASRDRMPIGAARAPFIGSDR
jgi:hypothetical protein